MGRIAAAAAANTPPNRCPQGARCWVEALDPDDRADLEQLLADDRRPASNISEVLRTAGVQVSTAQVRYHRRRECRCE